MNNPDIEETKILELANKMRRLLEKTMLENFPPSINEVSLPKMSDAEYAKSKREFIDANIAASNATIQMASHYAAGAITARVMLALEDYLRGGDLSQERLDMMVGVGIANFVSGTKDCIEEHVRDSLKLISDNVEKSPTKKKGH